MHPLTVTWAPHAYTDVGRRNMDTWLAAGFDNLLVTPNPRVHRTLTRLAFVHLLHPFQPFVLGQRSLAPKIAQRFDIGLVFFGEDDAEYEGQPGWQEQPEVTEAHLFESRHIEETVHISGVPVGALLRDHGLTKADLWMYLPPYVDHARPMATHALGHYVRWDPEAAYYFAAEHGFEANEERTEGTFTKFNSIDDRLDPLHYFTTFTKFGVGRASHDASMEIRHGRLTREEGVGLVHRYDHEIRESTVEFACAYMGLTVDEFWATIKRFKREYPQVA